MPDGYSIKKVLYLQLQIKISVSNCIFENVQVAGWERLTWATRARKVQNQLFLWNQRMSTLLSAKSKTIRKMILLYCLPIKILFGKYKCKLSINKTKLAYPRDMIPHSRIPIARSLLVNMYHIHVTSQVHTLLQQSLCVTLYLLMANRSQITVHNNHKV